MRTFQADSTAPPATAWALYARPAEWHRWAPHLRGAWGLDGPGGEVRAGARGAVRLLGAVPIPARITSVDPGRAWSWQVGPVTMTHRVEPAAQGDGCTVALELRAPAPLEPLVAATYGPLVQLLLRRLAATAQLGPV